MPYSWEQLSERLDKINTKIRDNVKQMEEDVKNITKIINEKEFADFRSNLTTMNLNGQEDLLEQATDFIQDALNIIKLEKKRRELSRECGILQNRAKVKNERRAKRLQHRLVRNPYARENSQEKDIGDK